MIEDGFDETLWKLLAEKWVTAYQSGEVVEEELTTEPRWLESLPKKLVDHQRQLQGRAARKFSRPYRWLWTRTLLEQASDEAVAKLSASFFPSDVPVVDACCGAGADTVALATRGPIMAIDASSVATALTTANLATHGFQTKQIEYPKIEIQDISFKAASVITADVRQLKLDRECWLHIDPDRRADQQRTIRAENFEPDLDYLISAIQNSAGGSIKVAPATNWEAIVSPAGHNSPMHDVSGRLGLQFVSWGGSVRQQRWWWNVEAFPMRTVTVSVADRQGVWSHWSSKLESSESRRGAVRVISTIDLVQGFIGDGDPALRASKTQGQFALEHGLNLIENSQGYFQCSSLADDCAEPWVDWFEVEAVMALDRKKVKKYLREHKVGQLEIKVRGVECSIETLRRELKINGEFSRTLLITRCGRGVIAMVAKRVHALDDSESDF
jgi:hypothetical protein